jgi:2-polyprenyl-6-methoxyphenol hydroxylase-like FAD-dependent oxidoreductase
LQGYRIHVDPNGSQALHDCLPSKLFEEFVATCGKPGGGMRIMTHELKELMFLSGDGTEDPIARHRSVSRITLRQVLLAGLEDDGHFGKQFSHFEDSPNGRVMAHFDDGTSAIGDLLVGADGVHSKVRQQFLPHAEPVDTGVAGIAAKVPLSSEFVRFEGANSIMGPQRDGMFIARQEFQRHESQQRGPIAFDEIGGNDGAASLSGRI